MSGWPDSISPPSFSPFYDSVRVSTIMAVMAGCAGLVWAAVFIVQAKVMGTNLVLGPPEKFYRRNPSGTFRDVHWYHLDNPKKVPGAPSQGFLIF